MVKNITEYGYLKPFLFNEGEIHLADISKKLALPHPTVRLYLNQFESLGILIKKNKGKLTFYSLNKESPFLIEILSLAEKENLYREMLKDLLLRETVEYMHKNLKNCNILIFGSASVNIKKAEDIDILVIGKIDKKIFLDLEKKIGKKVHLINVLSFSEINSSLKLEIKKKHLIISGVEEIVKWLV